MSCTILPSFIAKAVKMKRNLCASNIGWRISIRGVDMGFHLAARNPFLVLFVVGIYKSLRLNADDSVVPKPEIICFQ
ncbi:hypothetical protein WM32_25715 [Burkholderia ubonensis]|nr:hypothetical protein WI79_15775 [Burkholderia ubonensis]KVD36192.1 hypothetical protein WI83_11210 [Burkholderia ubonensis]KVD72946.1 hypothetical protein WI88_28730 [Burkholderia ubonensis]KVN50306.1 hypothetical protein WJ64_19325 [Burkholderia ubonensis]KWO81325.1 hypothetical protein WM32_25715 [Burkholderia ubonensis]